MGDHHRSNDKVERLIRIISNEWLTTDTEIVLEINNGGLLDLTHRDALKIPLLSCRCLQKSYSCLSYEEKLKYAKFPSIGVRIGEPSHYNDSMKSC